MISLWVILPMSLWVGLATDAELGIAEFVVSGSTNILFILSRALIWSMERVFGVVFDIVGFNTPFRK